jgi:hypothetical protein
MPSKTTIDFILDKIGLKPSPEQNTIIIDKHRIIQVRGGWRSGKSTVGAAFLLSRYWLGERFAIVGADYELCRPEFGYLLEFAQKLGIAEGVHFPSRDQCTLTLSRGKGVPPVIIETKSAKYPERLAGVAYDGILLVEAAQLPYDIFILSLGRLVERNGWLLMTGTLELSTDWYANKSEEYVNPDNVDKGISYSLPSWANPSAFPGGRYDPKLVEQEQIIGHDLFMQRYGGETIKPRDLVIPEFRHNIHTGRYTIDRDLPVYLAIDPGYYPAVYAVEFIQYRNEEMYVVDEIYQQHMVTEQIIKLVEDKNYLDRIEEGTIDVQATKHNMGENPTSKAWKDKLHIALHANTVPVDYGVDRIRSFFIPNPLDGHVRIHIDRKCKGLISELGGCKSPFADEGRGSWRMKQGTGKPDSANCDAIKAVIYETIRQFGLLPKRGKRTVTYMREV